tara:strand:+ start:870 stop:1145 length:276 start_codon:yes stop_codon:yes gene_type:complete
MRIPDEKRMFEIGDSVVLVEGTKEHNPGDLGEVVSIIGTSNYYEARPIASYMTWTYVVKLPHEKVYLSADKLSSALKNGQNSTNIEYVPEI